MPKSNILFIEDVPSEVETMEIALRNANIEFSSMQVNSQNALTKALNDFPPDLIICGNNLTSCNSLSILKSLKATAPEIPFILTTNKLTDRNVDVCLHEGAYSYVLKSNLIRLAISAKNALSKTYLQLEIKNIETENKQLRKYDLEHKDIDDSIKYAKQIQNALLPKESFIKQYFPESFLINMPKNIVSGDFYWISQLDDKIIVAVGDCTGHGVPAALISMVGYEKLNNIVNKSGVTVPAEILSRLNFEIQELFNNEDKETTIRDGMDIAICSIDKTNNTLIFAGAKRPLFYIRNNELEIIKGDRKCIGDVGAESGKDFTNHIIPLDSLNCIYLFTDGFIDQFGEAFGKKFLTKRFKNLLAKIQSLSMKVQKEVLLTTLHEWKCDEEQTDDICVLGLRF